MYFARWPVWFGSREAAEEDRRARSALEVRALEVRWPARPLALRLSVARICWPGVVRLFSFLPSLLRAFLLPRSSGGAFEPRWARASWHRLLAALAFQPAWPAARQDRSTRSFR